MAQVVVYGHAAVLRPRIPELSDAIHAAAVDALGLPPEKRFHRFTITETPRSNWGIRGVPADELQFGYAIDV